MMKTNDGIDYTFIVITYNQECVIVQALESIRFQIEQYGEAYHIQIVICDDASYDRTRVIADKWLERYENLFLRIDKVYHTENVGTCRNFTDGLRLVKGTSYREMAGDDIIPRNNIFEILDRTKDTDVVTAVVLPFTGNTIQDTYSDYRKILLQAVYTKRQLRFLTKVMCPILNGNVMSKKLVTPDVLRYIERYKLIEDRPLWYYIFKKNSRLSYSFSEKPALLYRISDSSVTHTDSPVRLLYEFDMRHIYDDILADKPPIFVRLCIHTLRFHRYINLGNLYLHGLLKIHAKKLDALYQKVILPEIKENEVHLRLICQRAEQFMKSIIHAI